jgi:OmcA/MtrC family decaheme c-type cytochrome
MSDFSSTSPFMLTQDTSAGATSTTTVSSGTASVTVYLGWSATEHTNVGNGSTTTPASAQTKSLIALPNALTATKSGTCGQTTACTFSTTITLNSDAKAAVAAMGSSASFVVAVGGRVKTTLANNSPVVSGLTALSSIPVKATVAYFDAVGTALAAADSRRVVALASNCDNCHAQVQAHGGARADNVQLCVICHNANNTDISNRAIDDPSGSTVDGKKEQAVDMKVHIHGIHAGGMRENPYVVSGGDFSGIRFPGQLNRCTNCHTATGYTLPISTAALGTTTNSNPAAATVLAARQKTIGTLSFSQGTTAVPATTPPVDLVTGAVTITNHGLVTGDSVTLSVTGTATLPTGWAAGSYFVDVVDNSHFTLNQGAGTVIPSALGVGSVSIAVPTSVNTGANTIQFANHGLVIGQVVRSTDAKYGLAKLTDYTVTGVAPNTFQLVAVTLTADATSPALSIVPKALIDTSDNGRTTPTASVCSTCHDSAVEIQHMKLQGAGFTLATGAVTTPIVYDGGGNLINLGGTGSAYIETCPICHGPGAIADVKVMHDVP